MLSMETEPRGNHQGGQWGGGGGGGGGSGSFPEDDGYGDPTDIYGKIVHTFFADFALFFVFYSSKTVWTRWK